MRIYTTHLRAGRAPRLVREAFSWGAALFGFLWFAWSGAWIVAAIDLAMVVALSVLVPPPYRWISGLALFLLHGGFGRDLVRWNFGLRGWEPGPVVAGRAEADALVRLLGYRPGLLDGVPIRAL